METSEHTTRPHPVFRHAVIVSSALVLALAWLHQRSGGLIIGMHADGSKWYSNELLSSGGDDSAILLLGLGSFVVSLLWYGLRKTNTLYVYLANLAFVWFVLFLVNLDVSLVGSIRHGDYVLAAMLVLIHVPLVIYFMHKRGRPA